MPVVERLMKPGTFDLQLIPETPKWVRDILQPFGHVLIFEAPLDLHTMADADCWNLALYAGVLRRKPTPYRLTGAHITAWLGDEEGKAWTLFAAGLTQTHTFLQWLTDLGFGVAGTPIAVGTWTATPGGATIAQTFKNQTPRSALDWLCGYFTTQSGVPIEYRMRGQNVLDAGPSASIFVTTPTVIVMPREGGRDALVGIEPTIFDLEIDGDSYTSLVVLVGGAGQGQSGGASPYKDPLGNLVTVARVVQNPQTPAGKEATVAATQLALYPIRQAVTLSTDRYDIPHDIRAGDWLYAYDPERDLVDLTNQQNYRGQIVWPVKLRVFALSWPIEGGMSVFYRDGNAVYTDLTPYVQFESPGTQFEVGAPVRPLT